MKAKALITLIALYLLSTLGFSAVDMFLKIEGIDGESKDSKHQGWIDVLSVSEIKSPRDAASGMATGKRQHSTKDAASGLPTGKRQHKPISIVKRIDKSSPMLAKALASGSPLKNVKVSQNGHVTVLKLAYVVSIKKDKKGNEVITLSETKIGTRATDYNSSRSNKQGIAADLEQDEDEEKTSPANHNTTRSNRLAPQ